MPGKKRSLEEDPIENVRRLRSRTIRIRNQAGNQQNVSSSGNDKSGILKEYAADPSSLPESFDIKDKRDTHHLLNIFPEELWILVSEKIDDSTDLEKLSKSSLFFRDLLLPQRAVFLFENVWKILANQNEEATLVTRFDGASWTWDYWYDAGIPVENRKGRSELLALRLVCRSWSKAVDFYYQNHPLHRKLQNEPTNNDESDEFLGPLLQDDFTTMIEQRCQHFLHHFKATHASVAPERNPFFARRIFLGCSWQMEDPQRASREIRNILSEYGHHIWYCTLHVTGRFFFTGVNEVNPAVNYRTIRQILELMPNLKVLEVKYDPVGEVTAEEQIELRNEIETNPFPTFKNLELLSTTFLFTPIFNELIRSNGHISTLDVRRLGHHEDYEMHTLPMPNLKTLSTKYFSDADFQKLNCLRTKWPLEKLDLRFDRMKYIGWQRVFDMIHSNWSETLTHLEIRMPLAFEDVDKRRIKRKCGSFRLNLPYLTFLKIDLSTATCLDFLLPTKNSLSVLKIDARESIRVSSQADLDIGILMDAWNNVEKRKTIKLLSCSQSPWKTNMWRLFPKLELIECEQKVTKYNINNWDDVKTDQSKWSRSRKEWEKELQEKTQTMKRQKKFC